MEKKFTIVDQLGLSARPASAVVSTTGSYSCDIKLKKGSTKVDAKSILGLMSLGIKHNDEITFICDGIDAEEALKAIENTLRSQNLI